jgi:hypothetical protein
MIDNLEFEEIESNVIALKQPKKPLYYVQRLSKIAHFFNQPKYLIQFCEIYINTASDKELFDFIQGMVNLPISYPQGFTRDFALGVINKLKTDNPNLLAQFGKGLLLGYLKTSQDIGFIFKDENIHCMFMFNEDEPELSGYIIIGLRGNHIEKARAGATFLKFWHNSYQRYWYDKGYRFIWANSFTPHGKTFISHAGAKEPKHVFFSRQANHAVRYNSKIHWFMDYRWDLKKKYG